MHKIILFILALSVPLLTFGKEKITLGTFLIPRYVQSPSKGEFIELVRELSVHSGLEVKIVVLPPKRTLKAFKEKSIDGYFPALDTFKHGAAYKTSDFYIKEDFIFERYKDSYKSKKNPTVCLTRGYPYSKNILNNSSWNYLYAASDMDCFRLLNKKRVDLFVGEEITGLSAIRELKLEKIVTYNKYTPISEQRVYFAFQNNKIGKEKSQKFDKALKALVISGKYDKLFYLKGKK